MLPWAMRKLLTAATSRIGRRDFIAGALALGVAHAAPFVRRGAAQPRLPGPLFTLGIASGYPTPTGVVLWTRLAPSPLMPGGGMPPEVVPCEWEVATDERVTKIVQRRCRRRDTGVRACRARRGRGSGPGALVLVSLSRRR
jgi:phosphodiesterase/alkaline phosphatase D-like protein